MNADIKKQLESDPDGLSTYEYIANHIDTCNECMEFLVDNMIRVDLSGQFSASAAQYLSAIDPSGFKGAIDRLVAAVIDKDREHKFLASLMEGVYGRDYLERAASLRVTDDNFRRLEKRINASTKI